jgi:phosphoribosyl 1,2-cyclic phosphodiesterase
VDGSRKIAELCSNSFSPEIQVESFKQIRFLCNPMPLHITSLNSGSNGNCYYIGNDKEAVLVDAGISCRETERRMKRLGLLIQRVKAIFVSHEHSDHIRGISVLAEKYQLPVFITPTTLQRTSLHHLNSLIFNFRAGEEIQIGNLSIKAFPKIHDAADPHSFLVSCQGIQVGVFTDIGAPCNEVLRHFKLCNAAILEANYDEEMLDRGNYPYYLKNRIRGGQGHLSNRQALALFKAHRPAFMTHLLLGHLSKNNNSPDLVQAQFAPFAGSTKVLVAPRTNETPVFSIGHFAFVQGELFK